MADDGIEVFIRWVLRHGSASERMRPFMTVAALLSDDERLAQLQREAAKGWLDEGLAEELLTIAEPAEAVALLNGYLGLHISPELFKTVFDRTLAASSDIEVLSKLMWVAGMYLDRHPGEFQLPRKLADELLASDDFDHRLGGLKAIRHSTASCSEIVAHVIAALKRNDCHDHHAGFSLLRNLLEDKGPQLAEATDPDILDELRSVLTHLADTNSDAYTRRTAKHCSERLFADGTGND